MQAPIAKKIEKKLEKHGDIRIDNYYWLNDRENPEVIEYLNQENEYTKTVLQPTEEFQAKLFEEMKLRKSKYGIVSMCVGTGQGTAGIYELM